MSALTPSDPDLLASVKLGEGLRLNAYPDPLSPRGKQLALSPKNRTPGWSTLSGAPWTYGYGCTGPDVTPSSTCTAPEAEAMLVERLGEVMNTLDLKEPWWRSMDAERQRVFAEMTYNLGYGGVCQFHRALSAMESGNYSKAASEMRASLWYSQVGERAERLCERMERG